MAEGMGLASNVLQLKPLFLLMPGLPRAPRPFMGDVRAGFAFDQANLGGGGAPVDLNARGDFALSPEQGDGSGGACRLSSCR